MDRDAPIKPEPEDDDAYSLAGSSSIASAAALFGVNEFGANENAAYDGDTVAGDPESTHVDAAALPEPIFKSSPPSPPARPLPENTDEAEHSRLDAEIADLREQLRTTEPEDDDEQSMAGSSSIASAAALFGVNDNELYESNTVAGGPENAESDAVALPEPIIKSSPVSPPALPPENTAEAEHNRLAAEITELREQLRTTQDELTRVAAQSALQLRSNEALTRVILRARAYYQVPPRGIWNPMQADIHLPIDDVRPTPPPTYHESVAVNGTQPLLTAAPAGPTTQPETVAPAALLPNGVHSAPAPPADSLYSYPGVLLPNGVDSAPASPAESHYSYPSTPPREESPYLSDTPSSSDEEELALLGEAPWSIAARARRSTRPHEQAQRPNGVRTPHSEQGQSPEAGLPPPGHPATPSAGASTQLRPVGPPRQQYGRRRVRRQRPPGDWPGSPPLVGSPSPVVYGPTPSPRVFRSTPEEPSPEASPTPLQGVVPFSAQAGARPGQTESRRTSPLAQELIAEPSQTRDEGSQGPPDGSGAQALIAEHSQSREEGSQRPADVSTAQAFMAELSQSREEGALESPDVSAGPDLIPEPSQSREDGSQGSPDVSAAQELMAEPSQSRQEGSLEPPDVGAPPAESPEDSPPAGPSPPSSPPIWEPATARRQLGAKTVPRRPTTGGLRPSSQASSSSHALSSRRASMNRSSGASSPAEAPPVQSSPLDLSPVDASLASSPPAGPILDEAAAPQTAQSSAAPAAESQPAAAEVASTSGAITPARAGRKRPAADQDPEGGLRRSTRKRRPTRRASGSDT